MNAGDDTRHDIYEEYDADSVDIISLSSRQLSLSNV